MKPILVSVHPTETLTAIKLLMAQANHLDESRRDDWVARAKRENYHLRALFTEGNRRLAQPINASQRQSIKQIQSELLLAEGQIAPMILKVQRITVPAA
jgi:hypothetical protein